MRITRLLLSVLLLLFASGQVLAQSHNTTSGSLCKFAKNSSRSKNVDQEGHIKCAACDKEDKQEADAKKAEDKRVEEVRIAKANADLIAKRDTDAAALKKKQEEEKGVTIVSINMPAGRSAKEMVTQPAPPAPVMKKNYFYSRGERHNNQSVSDMRSPSSPYTKEDATEANYFIVNNDTLFNHNEFKRCVGVKPLHIYGDDKFNFPPNIGIVVLHKIQHAKGGDHGISDLVDTKGKRMLNNDSISAILHFADDYFILLKGAPFNAGGDYTSFPEGVIYNYKTKQSRPIPAFQIENRTLGVQVPWVVDGTRLPKTLLRPKDTYKALLSVNAGWRKHIVYYITNDSKLEEDNVEE